MRRSRAASRNDTSSSVTSAMVRASACLLTLLCACSETTVTGANDAGVNDAGTIDANAGPAVVGPNVGDLAKLISDGSSLFWLDFRGAIFTMPVGGGSVRRLATRAGTFLGVNAPNVVFFQNDGIYTLPKGAVGEARRILSLSTWQVAALRGDRLYWIGGDAGGIGGDAGAPTVLSAVSLGDGSAVTLTTLDFFALLPASSIGVTASSVFVANRFKVFKIPSTGLPPGSSPELISERLACEKMIADDDAAYCFGGNSPIHRIAADGTIVRLADVTNATSAAVDPTDIYWSTTDGQSGSIMKLSKSGGTPTRVGDSGSQTVAVDDAAVYWESAGSIKRWSKR